MDIDVVAAQLRTYATAFAGQVAGAAAYANGVSDQVWLAPPAAYVIPGDEDVEDHNDLMPGLTQVVRERVKVIVVLPTLSAGGAADPADRRGQAAAAQLRTLRGSIFSAILSWRPDWPAENVETRGLYYVGGRLLEFDRARFFYEFEFGLDTTITDADGFQPSGDPLVPAVATIAVSGSAGPATPITIDIPLT